MWPPCHQVVNLSLSIAIYYVVGVGIIYITEKYDLGLEKVATLSHFNRYDISLLLEWLRTRNVWICHSTLGIEKIFPCAKLFSFKLLLFRRLLWLPLSLLLLLRLWETRFQRLPEYKKYPYNRRCPAKPICSQYSNTQAGQTTRRSAQTCSTTASPTWTSTTTLTRTPTAMILRTTTRLLSRWFLAS